MVRLVQKSPAGELLPIKVGSVTLSEVGSDPITSIAPLAGHDASVATALQTATGVGLPRPNTVLQSGAVAAVWAGQGLAFVLGADCGTIKGAAITDQSDAWVHVQLTGPDAVAVLARLVPIDLRQAAFPVGSAARTLLGHMSVVIWTSETGSFEILAYRSMTQTLVHELEVAMIGVAARN